MLPLPACPLFVMKTEPKISSMTVMIPNNIARRVASK
jgi:hypothetical protein